MGSRITQTIAFRLTLWFSGIFTICAGVTFILFYYLAVQTFENQMDQELIDRTSEFTAIIRRNGLAGARELAVVQAQTAGEKVIFFRLMYPSGEVFATSHMSHWKGVKVQPSALSRLMEGHKGVFETIQMPATGEKARILYGFVAPNVILQSGIAMNTHARFLLAFKKVFAGAMAFIIIFSAVAGWLLVRKAFSGVERITATARRITGSNLAARVKQTGSRDELDQLAETFNSMLDRIENLVKSNREISDNIAHDLKSPITQIRGHAELALVQEDNLEDYRAMAANTIEASDRLLDMINTMLLISKAQAQEDDFSFEPVDLSQMVEEACDLFEPLIEDKGHRFIKEIEPSIETIADIRMLQRAFSNLLDNAVKYTPYGGMIRVTLCTAGDLIEIRVEDSGMGISPENYENIFKRFFREESSRTSPGTGLGLSLSRAIARKHSGDIFVENAPEQGSIFTLTLPNRNADVI